MGWEESCLGTHWVTVTLKDINGLTDLMINIYYEAADTEDSPRELYDTEYLSLVSLLGVNTGKLLHSVHSPDRSVHDFKFSLVWCNSIIVLCHQLLVQLVKDIVLKAFSISGIYWLELKRRRNVLHFAAYSEPSALPHLMPVPLPCRAKPCMKSFIWDCE